jgi:hypothetical protein
LWLITPIQADNTQGPILSLLIHVARCLRSDLYALRRKSPRIISIFSDTSFVPVKNKKSLKMPRGLQAIAAGIDAGLDFAEAVQEAPERGVHAARRAETKAGRAFSTSCHCVT